MSSAFSKSILISVFGWCLIQLACTLGIYFWLRGQGFYNQTERSGDTTIDGHESTTIFLFTFPQYIFAAISFHLSAKFRKPFYTNISFWIFLLVQFCIAYWLILLPIQFMKDSLKISHLDFYFRVIITGGSIFNGILWMLYELWWSKIFT